MLEDVYGRGGVAPGCEGIDGRNGDVAGEGLQAGTTDYSYVDRFWECQQLCETEGKVSKPEKVVGRSAMFVDMQNKPERFLSCFFFPEKIRKSEGSKDVAMRVLSC